MDMDGNGDFAARTFALRGHRHGQDRCLHAADIGEAPVQDHGETALLGWCSSPPESWVLRYAANEFEAGEHGGTHMDAPYHFYKPGKFVGELPLESLIVPLIIVDISSRVNGDPNFVLYKQHLDYMLNNNDGKPCMIIFKFGWSQFYTDRKKYLGVNERDGTLNFPGLSQEIAEWITTSYKNVVGVGVDVASLDPGSSTVFPVHQQLMAAGLFGMENVKLDTHVPEYGCTGIALPMKIAKGTGGPLRLVAICPKQTPTKF
ncbi:hypothetical protein MSG28_011774 [Choristoneura fumiferana]|uniref:Uncharacterized protein n=1 Tax=Choristoneura fumiferana TaxID=7141 RepID=A0ACC0KMR3_CHOFU|nr:hypothetical protein MSG28_011774 [Choristoneura fumiferana]